MGIEKTTHRTIERKAYAFKEYRRCFGVLQEATYIPSAECHGKQTDHSTVNTGGRCPTQLLEFSNRKEKNAHPTQKPVALMEYLIKTYTNEGDTVLDFVMGSGTTGVAAINQRRGFVGIELDVDYFNVAEQRIRAAAEKGGVQ